jgi:hypothetical protein
VEAMQINRSKEAPRPLPHSIFTYIAIYINNIDIISIELLPKDSNLLRADDDIWRKHFIDLGLNLLMCNWLG